MVDRPPVKFAGQLPEGTLNGLGVILGAVLDDEETPVFFVGTARLKKVEHVVDTGIDVAVLRIISIEALPNGKIGTEFPTVGELIAGRRSERIGDNPIDYDSASDAEWARLTELRQQIADYAARESMSDATLGEKVLGTVPGAGAGWRESVPVMQEFLLSVGEEVPGAATSRPAESAEDGPDAGSPATVVLGDADEEGPVDG